MHLHTESGHVLLFELASQVTLDEGGLLIIPAMLAIIFITFDAKMNRKEGVTTLDECLVCPAGKGEGEGREGQPRGAV